MRGAGAYAQLDRYMLWFEPLIIGFNIYSEVKVKELGNTEGSMFGGE